MSLVAKTPYPRSQKSVPITAWFVLKNFWRKRLLQTAYLTNKSFNIKKTYIDKRINTYRWFNTILPGNFLSEELVSSPQPYRNCEVVHQLCWKRYLNYSWETLRFYFFQTQPLTCSKLQLNFFSKNWKRQFWPTYRDFRDLMYKYKNL